VIEQFRGLAGGVRSKTSTAFSKKLLRVALLVLHASNEISMSRNKSALELVGGGLVKVARGLMTYLGSRTGSVAVQMAIAAPALMAAAGAASDMAIFGMKQSQLQSVADEAAIAAANELALGKTSQGVLQAAADAFVQAAIADPTRSVVSEATLGSDGTSVTVEVVENWTPFFAHFLGVKVTPVLGDATAALAGSANLCVLALNQSAAKSLELKSNAAVTAKNCSILVNSKAIDSVKIGSHASVTSAQLCTVGGVKNSGVADAEPTTDCPPIADPLAARAEPVAGSCDHTNYFIGSGSAIIGPGTYCGGIEITGTAQVKFLPGNYIVKNGQFQITGAAKVKGDNVGFFLKGNTSTLLFLGNAEIDFSGSLKDQMAGLLFFEDRSAPLGRDHRISSGKAHTLTGTIYLPRGNLRIDPGASVAGNSAYTVVIAQNLRLGKGPELTLNSNYDATNVPVPEGVRASTQVVLTE
jgi:hypothetical protein